MSTTTNCSAWQNNLSCDAMVCNTDWTKDTSSSVRNGFCSKLTGSFAVCGTVCGTTKWGADCCSASDYQNCFKNLAAKGCANGGSSGVTGTHALGSTSIISTVSGHALTVSATSSATSTGSVVAHATGTTTTASAAAATSKSAGEKSLSLGSRLTVYMLVTGILANILCA